MEGSSKEDAKCIDFFVGGELVAVLASKCGQLDMPLKKVGNNLHRATYDSQNKINAFLLMQDSSIVLYK